MAVVSEDVYNPDATYAEHAIVPPARDEDNTSTTVNRPGLTGLLFTVDDAPEGMCNARNHLQHQTVGSKRRRDDATVAETVTALNASHGTENLLHTVLYYHGSGGWIQTPPDYLGPKSCSFVHHNKIRLLSVNPKWAHADEFPHATYNEKLKRQFHAGATRVAPANVVGAPLETVLEQTRRDASLHLPDFESFTGGVGKTVVGGKSYWKETFRNLMAFCVTYGVPQYFATFTANEFGWSDMKRALDGRHFGERPVEATRHYFHRWSEFHKLFLADDIISPIGTIQRTWHRHEDQSRGSFPVSASCTLGDVYGPASLLLLQCLSWKLRA